MSVSNAPLVLVHDGVFHADEVVGAGILKIIFPKAKIIRTRDPAMLSRMAGTDDTFMLDVGGRYDPDQRQFDHHQPEGAGYRDEMRMWPYATSGLVWRHYGFAAVKALHPELDYNGVREVVHYMDEACIKFLDAVDCGVRLKSAGPNLSTIVGAFNPPWFEVDPVDDFLLVLELAQVVLKNFIKRYAGKVLARNEVRHCERIMDGRVLVLDKCLPWSSVVAQEMPDVLLTIFPTGPLGRLDGAGPQWQMRCASHDDKTPRMLLPLQWGGLTGDSLAAACKEPAAVFCHRGRHLAGARNKEGILHMAQRAMEHHDKAMGKPLSLPLAAVA